MSSFLDLTCEPFSRAGAWMSLSTPDRPFHRPFGEGLYLRVHFHRPLAQRPIFRLDLVDLDSGAILPSTAEASPTLLTLSHATGSIDVSFDGPDRLRLRGEGCGLRLTAQPPEATANEGAGGSLVVYPTDPKRWTVNARPSLRRFQLDPIAAELEIDAPWKDEGNTHVRIDARPIGEATTWELAVDLYNSTWIEPERLTWETVRHQEDAAWQGFADAFGSGTADPEARRKAIYLLWSCTMQPMDQLRRNSIFMSLNWMDQVWSWDNCFNATSLAGAHPELAEEQYHTVFDHQDAHGACPDGMNDQFKHYNFSKPPVQSLLLEWTAQAHPDFLDPARLRRLYEPIARFTRWWLEHRRWPGQTLCHYLHGNDSGWDNSSLLVDGSPLIAPDLNAFLSHQCRWLARTGAELGIEGSERWTEDADRLETALIDQLWDGECGRFVGLLPHRDLQAVRSRSLISLMPLVLGERLDPAIREAILPQVEEHLTDWGLATEPPDSPFYVSDGYWRGPIWGPSTHLMVIGLQASGAHDLARTVAERYLKLGAASGHAENYDAVTGAALRDRGYTWTAAVWLELERFVGK